MAEWTTDQAGGFIFRARPTRFNPRKWYAEAKRSAQPFVSDEGGVFEPSGHDVWFAFADSADEALRKVKAEVLN